MAILNVYVDADTMKRLKRASREENRSVEDLAEAAIAEAALNSDRDRRFGK
ncbi:Ribbon-helix-helix protein, copG family [Sphingomonas gellani]|uniref:Ribbon-helix-helix protein, copG family n=1 Tax=Sphingomonas gellani TaxID=1166340 RepID=A0A1H8C080_9SPHN|nr:ribbon-helix-helix protein, CopG family [Sphingomonas gellani]SEM88456.1 Ribbon-helix-helix protein, copG family [Sphingomonas gellani]